MATEQNTTKKIIRNGFAAVTRADIQNAAGVALEQIEVMNRPGIVGDSIS